MAPKQSIRAVVNKAVSADTKARKDLHSGTQLGAATLDSFVNFAQKLGVGADNALSTASYGYNPISRNRTMLEWIHRGSWLGGVAVDLVADDMTRAGIEFATELPPDIQEEVAAVATKMGIWNTLNEAIQWGRLYGGSICVALVDGQDMRTPLIPETVGMGQFKGLITLDRWMVEPSLEDLVTDYGPHLGLPKYYRVGPNAPALRGMAIHYSRVMLRMEGIRLPYQQRLTENLWGISVLERLYDRMIAYDSASTGAAQLVYKSYLRTLKIEGLRDIAAAGNAPLTGLMTYVDIMRRYQGQEGITLLDMKDEFDVQQHSAFSGLSDALNQFGQQLSGALQIPLVRLFGQSPAGLNSSGESDLRTYYDGIRQQQEKTMHTGVTAVYRMLFQSLGKTVPPTFGIKFASLWQLQDKEKADIAQTNFNTVNGAYDGGLISQQTALKELRQAARLTGTFTNITEEQIDAADAEIEAPGGEGLLDGFTDPQLPGAMNNDPTQTVGPNGQAITPNDGPRRRVQLLPEA